MALVACAFLYAFFSVLDALASYSQTYAGCIVAACLVALFVGISRRLVHNIRGELRTRSPNEIAGESYVLDDESLDKFAEIQSDLETGIR